jgi:hypothetical protein
MTERTRSETGNEGSGAHEHEHEPEHEHEHELAGPRTGGVLFFDACSGVAGDMFVAALLDMGVPMRVLSEALEVLPVRGYSLHRDMRWSSGIGATSFTVVVTEPQPERAWVDIDEMLASAQLPGRVRELAREVFRKLGEAEAHVHRTTLDRVHFHEVGAVDAIVDIVGACAMVAWLSPERLLCSPLPMGRGIVRARHGVMPLPAPAALQCLRGVPTYGVDVEGELVTPTGAALISTLAMGFTFWPSIVPEHIGFGAGTQQFAARPNLLRAVLGAASAAQWDEASGTHGVLEANVDDMTGELTGHAIRQLMSSGALDVWVTPTTTKKGRPGLVLSVLVESGNRSRVSEAILRETTTLGVRWTPVARVERPRREVVISTRYGDVPVKVASGAFGPEQGKPEFDACVRAAETYGVPVREVMAEALARFRGCLKDS